jgi:hypothetical protein
MAEIDTAKFFQVDLTPEMFLDALRSMPEVISAEYKDGKFFAETLQGAAEIRVFFPRNEAGGTS